MLIISVLRLDYKFKTSLGYMGRLPIYFYPFRATANLGSTATLVVATLSHCQAEGSEIQHAYLPGMRFRVERTNGKSLTYHHPEKDSWANQVSVHGVVKHSNKQLAQYHVFPVPALVESRYSHPITDFLATPT